MTGISSKAALSIQNNFQYQAAYSEHDDETGYNEFALRHYDAQVGRWTGVDPYQQFASPYTGMGNNPVNGVDPDGGFSLPQIGVNGSDFLIAAGNVAISSAVGYGLGYLVGGKNGAKWGAAIGFGISAGSYVPWDDVGNWIDGLFSSDEWLPFYKRDLVNYVMNKGLSVDENNLGDEFEKIFQNFMTENYPEQTKAMKFRKAKEKWTGGDVRNSKPDFVSDDFYDRSPVIWKTEMKWISEGSGYEVKQNNGKGIYLSSNDNQIKAHISNLSTKHSGDIATGSYNPSLTLITTYDVKWSPSISYYASSRGVQYTHRRSMYKIKKGKYKFDFVGFGSSSK